MNQNQDNKQKTRTSEDKLKILLATWIESEIQLAFHLRSGEVLRCKLLYYSRYEYVVQIAEDNPAVVILKYAVNYIERV